LRGRHRGRIGWISGNFEERAARGVTKAIVKLDGDVELLAVSSIERVDQLNLPLFEDKKKPSLAHAGDGS
jgi:hypothetical protein